MGNASKLLLRGVLDLGGRAKDASDHKTDNVRLEAGHAQEARVHLTEHELAERHLKQQNKRSKQINGFPIPPRSRQTRASILPRY